MRRCRLSAAFGCVVAVAACCAEAEETTLPANATVSVAPKTTDAILANPGMGWETFHHTSREDKSLPAWIPSTLHYARWGWGTLEPKPGQIDYAFLDGVLEQTHDSGQQLAFRVMCCSTTPGRPYHPDWLKGVGGKEIVCSYGGNSGFRVPDLDDPVVLQRHLDFIQRLGQRYDGHPDIAHVDMGTVGWWGEWHMSGSNCAMPTMQNRQRIVDAYLQAFRKTPVLMLVGGGQSLTYAAERGAGWRADCLGDMGGFSRTWCHMRMAYPQAVAEQGIGDAWKTAPVAWETCWDMRKWVDEDWSLRYIFNYALALHGCCINNKSAPLPAGEDVRPELERFLRRLGYRLVLVRLQHPAAARPGEKLPLNMQWQNTGSSPCYRPYRLAYRLTGADGYEKVFVGDVTVNHWLPGSIELFTEEFFKQPPDLPPGEVTPVDDTIALPADTPTGEYTLALAVVGEQTTTPVVQLGIAGRAADGWYPLSTIRVVR